MKKLLFLSLSLFILLSCEGPYIFNRVVKQADGGRMLLGGVNKEVFQQEPFSTWYFQEYDSYQLNASMVKDFKSKLKGHRIEVFMASWSDKSKEQFPRFMKILDEAKFPENRIVTYALNPSMKSFYGEEANKDIQHLPTFIFYKGGKEVGRIVEEPVTGSLEEDILKIVNGKALSPKYFEY
jgi:thiol-disulfide isomerase/thioredoxin